MYNDQYVNFILKLIGKNNIWMSDKIYQSVAMKYIQNIYHLYPKYITWHVCSTWYQFQEIRTTGNLLTDSNACKHQSQVIVCIQNKSHDMFDLNRINFKAIRTTGRQLTDSNSCKHQSHVIACIQNKSHDMVDLDRINFKAIRTAGRQLTGSNACKCQSHCIAT